MYATEQDSQIMKDIRQVIIRMCFEEWKKIRGGMVILQQIILKQLYMQLVLGML